MLVPEENPQSDMRVTTDDECNSLLEMECKISLEGQLLCVLKPGLIHLGFKVMATITF